MDNDAIKVSERAIMAKVGAIMRHHRAITIDERAIIVLNEQNNFSSYFFKEKLHKIDENHNFS